MSGKGVCLEAVREVVMPEREGAETGMTEGSWMMVDLQIYLLSTRI